MIRALHAYPFLNVLYRGAFRSMLRHRIGYEAPVGRTRLGA